MKREASRVTVCAGARSALVLALSGVALATGCKAAPSPHAAPAQANRVGGAERPTPGAPSVPFGLEYVEVMTGGAHASDAVPLVIALHGLGDTPGHFLGVFDGFPAAARIVAPHSSTPYSDGWEWFPPRGVTSELATPDIAAAADSVAAFAETTAHRFPTLGKPIVTGFSQGGALSFAVAVRHPASVSAAFPIGGWLPAALFPPSLPATAPPIVAFHGTADTRVPLDGTRTAVAHLVSLGFSARLQEFDGVEHGIPAVVRAALFDALATECNRQARAGAP